METSKMIYSRIADAMKEVEAIGKERMNSHQGYKFRGIDDVYNTLHPILARNRLFTVPRVISERSEERESKSGGANIYRVLTVEYEVFTDDGSSITACVIGEGMDSGDKATNKALSVAHKMFFFQLFSIPVEGETIDSEVDSHEVLPKKQLKQLAEEVLSPRDEFLDLYAKVNVPDGKLIEYAADVREKKIIPTKEAISKLKIIISAQGK